MSDQGKPVGDEVKGAAGTAGPIIGSADALLRDAVREASRWEPPVEARVPAPAPAAPKTAATRKVDAVAWLRTRTGLAAGLAASLVGGMALGGGGLAAYHRLERADRHEVTAAEWKRIAARLESGGTEGGKLAGDLKLLKEQVAGLRDQGDRARTEAAARSSQAAERLAQLQKAEKDVGERLANLTERLDRLDKDAAARIAALGERLDKRLPAQAVTAAAPVTTPVPVASATAKPAAPEDRTGSIPDTKAKPTTLDAWILRDVFDGVAVIEGRNQRLVEVAPGETLPGGGRVEAIERRGKTWVVVTSKGLITSQTW